MGAKEIRFGDQIQHSLVSGVDCIADAIKTTMGPKGRQVVIERAVGAPFITKNGAVVAQHLDLPNRFENAGAQLIMEMVLKAGEEMGDGATTAAVIAQVIVHEGMKCVAVGMNPMEIRRGIELATAAVLAELNHVSAPCIMPTDIENVAAVAANGDIQIGRIIANAIQQVGRNGAITVEEHPESNAQLAINITDGSQFDTGYGSAPYSAKSGSREVSLDNPRLLLVAGNLTDLKELLPILESAKQKGITLVVVAHQIADSITSMLTANYVKGVLEVCAVKTPGYGVAQGEALEDMALLTGATVIGEETGLQLRDTTIDQLGAAAKIKITKDRTTIIGGHADQASRAARARHLEAHLRHAASDQQRDQVKARIARLTGAVATIYVASDGESTLSDKKESLNHALRAAYAAMDEGVIAGGGVALLRSSDAILKIEADSQGVQAGINLVLAAIESPLSQIATNAGAEPKVVLTKVRNEVGDYGYNAATDQFGDLKAMGLLDSTKVICSALQRGSSIAGLILTTECMVVNLENT
jgi:chaperonin GroEL